MRTRRAFLKSASMMALGRALPVRSEVTPAIFPEPDYRLTIEDCKFEVARNKFLKTIAYNSQVPGPTLHLKQGRQVRIEITNGTSRPEIVHWHGLELPAQIDGASEEGTPMIAPGASVHLSFVPGQAGLRWYHTHTPAGSNLSLGQYSALHGLLMIAPAIAPPMNFDSEFSLVLHDWDAEFAASDDGTMEPGYKYSTINGKTEAFNEPLRVRKGERTRLQILNSSATDVHWLVFSGHRFTVLALDGNMLPEPRTVDMLRLAPAERVTAIVTMDNPGRWVLAEPRKHVRAAGMGIVVEYAGEQSEPQFQQPLTLYWRYSDFSEKAADAAGPSEPAEVVPIVIESKFRGHGAPEQWLLNGYAYPQPNAPVLHANRRYRLRLDNRSSDDHPVHLHRHTFRIINIGGLQFRGPRKDTVLVGAKSIVEVEFTANNPGNTLLHCHQQDHMDRGFMMVLSYA